MPRAHCFRYIVRPSQGRWEVTFGDGGSLFVYASEGEAVEVARRAGRLHWQSHGAPCEVTLELPGRAVRIIATFDHDA